jgi:hypothetical protein
MKYKVKITKQPRYDVGGGTKVAKKDAPKIKVDAFGIATDQYGNKYYKPHGSTTYKLDPNQGGYWSHVASVNSGWNESDYKNQEIAKLKELLPWNNSTSDKYSIWEELGALGRTPANALNATLSGNYEPFSVSRRRLSDSKFNPNSGKGVALDVFTDPMIFPEIPEFLAKQSWRGLKYVAPILADHAALAAKYVGNKAKIAGELALKYGKKTADYVVKYAPELYDKVSRFKYALNKGQNQIDNQNDEYQKAVLQYSNPQQNPVNYQQDAFAQQNAQEINQQPSPSNYQQQLQKLQQLRSFTQQPVTQQSAAPQVDPNIVHPSSYRKSGNIVNNPVTKAPNVQQQYSNDDEQPLQYKGGNRSSLVDLLKYNGIDSSMAAREKLAEDTYGINDYTGTYDQNVKLKSLLENKKQAGGAQDAQQQIIQAVAQMLQQGASPEQVMQQLMQKGMPKEMTQQVVQMVMQQMQGQQQGPQEEQMEPQMAYGGQMGYGLDLGARRLWMNQDDDKGSEVTDSIEEVPREQANIEAEGGETALIPYKGDGTYIHKKIKGNRHTEGGVPLNVPEGTFIYSDTKKMKLGGPVLQMFGKSEKSTKKFTPATLAKQYNIDKYRAILNNPKSDPIVMRTAQLMIQNYEKKLAQLALVQESKKGFPQGIPEVARDYYQQMQQMQQAEQGGQSVALLNQSQQQGEQPQAMYGGFRYGGGLDRYQGDVKGSEVRSYNGVDYSPAPTNFNPNLADDFTASKPENEGYTYYNKPGAEGVAGTAVPQGIRGRIDPNSWKYAVDKYAPQGATLEDLKNAGHLSAVNDPNVQAYWQQRYKAKSTGTPAQNYYTRDATQIPALTNPYQNPAVFGNIQPIALPTVVGQPATNSTKTDDGSTSSSKFMGVPYAWNTPDKLGMLNSLINWAGVKRSTPFESTKKLDTAESYYKNDTGALAANAGQMNAARQAAAMLAGPAARHSFNAGEYGANAANIIGQYANENVGIANQAAQQVAAINNQQMEFDAQRAKRLYDAGVIDEQQYQNAIREARAATLKSYAQGYTNASTLYNLNKTTADDYIIDPRSGLLRFNPSGGKENFMAKQTGAIDINSLRKAFPKADDNTLARIYASMYNSRSNKRRKSNQSSNDYGYDDDFT